MIEVRRSFFSCDRGLNWSMLPWSQLPSYLCQRRHQLLCQRHQRLLQLWASRCSTCKKSLHIITCRYVDTETSCRLASQHSKNRNCGASSLAISCIIPPRNEVRLCRQVQAGRLSLWSGVACGLAEVQICFKGKKRGSAGRPAQRLKHWLGRRQ